MYACMSCVRDVLCIENPFIHTHLSSLIEAMLMSLPSGHARGNQIHQDSEELCSHRVQYEQDHRGDKAGGCRSRPDNRGCVLGFFSPSSKYHFTDVQFVTNMSNVLCIVCVFCTIMLPTLRVSFSPMFFHSVLSCWVSLGWCFTTSSVP